MDYKSIDYSEFIGNKLSDFKEIERTDSEGIKYNYTTLGKGFLRIYRKNAIISKWAILCNQKVR